MLIERSPFIIGVIAAAVLLTATAFALFLTRGMFASGHEITAYFTDAAGLAVDDQVLLAGVRSGRVEAVETEDGLAKVSFIVDGDIPSDSRVRIQIQNLLGRRLLYVVAGSDWDELLSSGDVIPVERTSTPVDVPEFGEETDQLARETDEEALDAVVTALADITEGQREEVGELLDGLQRLSAIIAERRDELQGTIVGTERLFSAFEQRDDEIVRIIDAFGSTLDMLANRRGDVQELLRNTADASESLADLVETERTRIDRVLRRLHEDLTIVDRNQVDIAHFFAYSGPALIGFSSVGYDSEGNDTPYWGNMHASQYGNVGYDPLFGCGGLLDQALDPVFGEDPRSCREQDAEPVPTRDGDDGGGDSPLPVPEGLSSFFQMHDSHYAELEFLREGGALR